MGGAAILAFLALQTVTVSTTVEETTETLYSDIEGRSEQDIADWFSAQRFGGMIGSTQPHWSAYYQFETVDGQCALTGVTAYLHITFTLPRWVEEDQGSRRVRRQWQTFLTNLQTHEDGHAEIARRGAAIVMERLSQMPPAATCGALTDSLDALSDSLWDRLEISQREYDQATEHGRTQGAYIEFRSRR